MTRKTKVLRRHANSSACADCGSPDTTSRNEIDEFDYLHGNELIRLNANVDVHTCQNCGFQFTDGSAEDARHEAVCKFLGVLTPAEIKAVRAQYGLSRSQMASITRIGEASLARWESGALVQSGAYGNFLFLLRYAENLQRLQQRNRREEAGMHVFREKNWRCLTVTESVRQEQSAFRLNPIAA